MGTEEVRKFDLAEGESADREFEVFVRDGWHDAPHFEEAANTLDEALGYEGSSVASAKGGATYLSCLLLSALHEGRSDIVGRVLMEQYRAYLTYNESLCMHTTDAIDFIAYKLPTKAMCESFDKTYQSLHHAYTAYSRLQTENKRRLERSRNGTLSIDMPEEVNNKPTTEK